MPQISAASYILFQREGELSCLANPTLMNVLPVEARAATAIEGAMPALGTLVIKPFAFVGADAAGIDRTKLKGSDEAMGESQVAVDFQCEDVYLPSFIHVHRRSPLRADSPNEDVSVIVAIAFGDNHAAAHFRRRVGSVADTLSVSNYQKDSLRFHLLAIGTPGCAFPGKLLQQLRKDQTSPENDGEYSGVAYGQCPSPRSTLPCVVPNAPIS